MSIYQASETSSTWYDEISRYSSDITSGNRYDPYRKYLHLFAYVATENGIQEIRETICHPTRR